ncbi:hypothetical protein ONZ45_g8807 [Pleurotus djamor]|nr:hypothetical protein ONZ45_g8807 [Pleurotus djamor]
MGLLKLIIMSEPLSFDYVIVGAGVAGLVVAARLAEDESKTVAVLEAGDDVSSQPNVQIPGLYSQNLAKPDLDWGFMSTPQKHLDGRVIYLPRGKGIGGSSNLNFLSSGRASSTEYDAFESLGAKGWNWKELSKYFIKSETFTASSEELEQYDMKPDPNYVGTSGPLKRSLAGWNGGDMFRTFYKALHSLGVPSNPDSFSGDTVGTCVTTNAVDPSTCTRSSSATAYYQPNKDKPNLTVITDAHVSRVLLSKTPEGAKAEGVEYLHDGTAHIVLAKREVIISAGSFQTPQVLELSGIGDINILSAHSIPVIVNLPGVGANLQEHITTMFVTEMDSKYDSLDRMTDPAQAAAEMQLYQEKKQGVFTSTASVAYSFLPLNYFADAGAVAAKAAVVDNSSGYAAEKVRKQHEEWLTNDKVPQLEFVQVSAPFPVKGLVPKPGKKHFSFFIGLMHPLSAGSVHISSPDPLAEPDIDMNLLSNPVDLDILIAAIRYSRKVISTDALKDIVQAEVAPGPNVQTDEELGKYIKENLGTVFHPVGTAAMLPREDRGVVDENLKVYGTMNLRVVDASVIPIQIAAHSQLTVYAIAEKASNSP